jgi:hypothetical protein
MEVAMKTSKIILFAIAMAIATVGFTNTGTPPTRTAKPSPTIALKITLKAAMQKPELVRAMHAQLNSSFLSDEKPIYIVPVRVKKNTYYIAGTYEEWKWFFRIKAGAKLLDQ